MDRSNKTEATLRPGPPVGALEHRRGGTQLRVWSAEHTGVSLDEIDASLRRSASAIREMRCLIDRLGAIPMLDSD